MALTPLRTPSRGERSGSSGDRVEITNMRPREFASIDLHLAGQQSERPDRSCSSRPTLTTGASGTVPNEATRRRGVVQRGTTVLCWRRSRSLAAPSTQAVPDVAY
jgi:hypothetical protein